MAAYSQAPRKTAGSTTAASATAVAANLGRQYLLIQNTGPTNDMWVELDGKSAAVATTCVRIAPKGSITFDGSNNLVPSGKISVIQEVGATTFVIYEA